MFSQARDPSVHAAILQHLNEKYGEGSGKEMDLEFEMGRGAGQAALKVIDPTKNTSDLSEDLFKVHDFDVKIDLQVPNAGETDSFKCLRNMHKVVSSIPASRRVVQCALTILLDMAHVCFPLGTDQGFC